MVRMRVCLSGRDGVGLSGRDGVGLSGRDGGGSQWWGWAVVGMGWVSGSQWSG